MTIKTVTAVLIPGFMLDETLWQAFVPYIPEHWDIHYASISSGKTISQIASDIIESHTRPLVIIGFSLGGYIARQIAADYPERVKGLILIASSLRNDTENQRKAKKQMLEIYSPQTFKHLSTQTIVRSLHPKNRNNYALISHIQNMSSNLGYKILTSQSELVRSDVPSHQIQSPTLVIGSTQDTLRSVEESFEIKENIKNADMSLVDQSGHMIPLEQPEELANIVISWVNSHVS